MPRRKVFYGWWMVLVSAILAFFAGGTFLYGFTLFFNPIRQTFGWTATITSVAFALRGVETSIFDLVVGFLVDKVGPRKLMLPGWGIIGLGFLLMSRINSLWAFYALFVIIAIGFSFGSFVVTNTVVAHWFTKKRSRAMTLIYLGPAASGLLAPLLALSISQSGWRETLIILGIASWVIGLPLSLLMRHKPSQYGYLPDGETRATTNEATNGSGLHSSHEIVEPAPDSLATGFTAKVALRTRAFWLLALAFFFKFMASSVVTVHIVPYLESLEVSTTIAATAVTGLTLSSLIGRIGFGFLGDFTNKRYLIAIAVTLQLIGLFIFSLVDTDRMWLIIPFLLTFGPGYGGPIPLRSALIADYFGTKSYGTIFGWMAFFSMLGGIVSPVIAGWIFDVTGSYHSAWQLFTLLTLPAIPLILLARPPKANQEP